MIIPQLQLRLCDLKLCSGKKRGEVEPPETLLMSIKLTSDRHCSAALRPASFAANRAALQLSAPPERQCSLRSLILSPDGVDAHWCLHFIRDRGRSHGGHSVEFSAQLGFEVSQLGVNLRLLLFAADQVLPVPLQEVADGFHANLDGTCGLVFVDVFER